jgi:hypothetical protein
MDTQEKNTVFFITTIRYSNRWHTVFEQGVFGVVLQALQTTPSIESNLHYISLRDE